MKIHRPSIHQLRVLEWSEAGRDATFSELAEHIEHMAQWLPENVTSSWRNQLANVEASNILESRDLRAEIIGSADFSPTLKDSRIKAALFAYQEGTSVLMHSIWTFGGQSDVTWFERIASRLRYSMRGLQGHLGEGLLFTGVPIGSKHWVDTAQQLLGLPAVPIPMNGCTFFVPDRLPLQLNVWRAVLFFNTVHGEQSLAAGRLVTLEWPRIVQYHRRLDHMYLDIYRSGVATQHASREKNLRDVIGAAFAKGDDQHIGSSRPSEDLVRIAGAQYSLLQALGEAERLGHEARREYENLIRETHCLASVTIPAARDDGADSIPAVATRTRIENDASTALMVIADRGRHFVEQILSDVAAMKISVETADRALTDLRTQADIAVTAYTRRLSWIVAIIGLVAALPVIIDNGLAIQLYKVGGFDGLSRHIFGSRLPVEDQAFFVHIFLIIIIGFMMWLFIVMLGWVRKPGRR